MTRERLRTVTEVCSELGVKPHILRYWEQEFEMKVKRNSAGRRVYTSGQLERLRDIRRLVHIEKLTIRGARRRLQQSGKGPAADERATRPDTPAIIDELRAISTLLNLQDYPLVR